MRSMSSTTSSSANCASNRTPFPVWRSPIDSTPKPLGFTRSPALNSAAWATAKCAAQLKSCRWRCSSNGSTGMVFSRAFSRSHRTIGLQYFFLALASCLAGLVLSLLMRFHVVHPEREIYGIGAVPPELYLSFLTMHGTLMVFFVLTTAPQAAFGNLFLSPQPGKEKMAVPVLNMISFW